MQVQPPNCVPYVQGLCPILPHGAGAWGVLGKVQPPPQSGAWRQEGAVPGHLSPASGLTQAGVRVAGGGAQPWRRGGLGNPVRDVLGNPPNARLRTG